MRLQILDESRPIKLMLSSLGRALEYSEGKEVSHLVNLCFPERKALPTSEDTKAKMLAASKKTTEIVQALRTRKSVASEIELLLDDCKVPNHARYDTTMESEDGTSELPAICLTWRESPQKFIGILVNDAYCQIVSPVVPPGTILNNDDTLLVQKLTELLNPYF